MLIRGHGSHGRSRRIMRDRFRPFFMDVEGKKVQGLVLVHRLGVIGLALQRLLVPPCHVRAPLPLHRLVGSVPPGKKKAISLATSILVHADIRLLLALTRWRFGRSFLWWGRAESLMIVDVQLRF